MPIRVEGRPLPPSAETRDPAATHPTSGSIAECPFHNAINAGDATKLRDVAMETMKDRVFGDQSLKKAQKVLEQALQTDPVDAKGETNRLMGLVAFQDERWGDAVRFLEIAKQRDPKNDAIQKVLDRAKQNISISVSNLNGPTHAFDAVTLLQPPAMHIREPSGMAPMPEAEQPGRVRTALRNAAGHAGHAAMEAAVSAADHFRDKDATFAFESWDSRGDLRGKLELAAMREQLNKDPLQSTYDGTVGFQAEGQVKPEWTDRVRTATGAWTTNEPMEGAAGTEIQRTGAPVTQRKNRALDPTLPNPREVSRALMTADGPRKEAPFLNNLAIAWIQFQVHDWVNHAPGDTDGTYRIPLAPDDPLRKTYGMEAMFVPKTAKNVLPQDGKITYLNEVTHWWDGSQIYGSDQATQDRLRTGADGKMLADGQLRIEGDELPINGKTGTEDTGFARNWWVGLDIFHTLFVKNHNSIALALKKAHPDWSSDQLFHTARLVNSAEMAKIHTVEWTPAVLPNKKLVGGMGANWWGLLEDMRKPFSERRVDNGWEPKDPVLGGIVGGTRDNHGKPFGLTEEFDEVYRLHSGMADHIDILPIGAKKPVATLGADATRGTAARPTMEKYGMETLLNSFGNQHMAALVHNNYPAFMQDMSVQGNSVVDLGAIDVLRARERGVPPYNEFRRQLGLNPIKKFEDLGCDDATLAKLKELYGDGPEGVEKMDLLAGTMCEMKRPSDYGFGETLFQVFIQMASRRLQADPFYTDKFTAQYYSKEGMDMIEHCTLKGLLLQHFPELAKAGLAGVNNAFEPWGTTAETNPEEHPLTAKAERY